MWGIIPAAGIGSRIQPLAFSKELLPVGSILHNGIERPKAICEYLIERMLIGGVQKICLVISTEKLDIIRYFGDRVDGVDIYYTIQSKPLGLCDAVFRAVNMIHENNDIIIGLPDTLWFPLNGFQQLPKSDFSMLLFPVKFPQYYDAVELDLSNYVQKIKVKDSSISTPWIWGAMKMSQFTYYNLYQLWINRKKADEYLGTLINEYINTGGKVQGCKYGEKYIDVGTVSGYREAIQMLTST